MQKIVSRFFLTLFFCLAAIADLSAVPRLEIPSYDVPTDFNKKTIILISKGDDPAWKNSDFDDSKWAVTSLPSEWSTIYRNYNGICWYRLHFKLPVGTPDRNLGISLGTIVDADEVYCNGFFVGRSGSVSGSDSAYDKTRIYELPVRYLKPGAENILAIRIRGIFSYMNGPYSGDMKFDRYDRLVNNFFIYEIINYTFVLVYFIVAFFFLLFFFQRRKDSENLWFALFSIGMGFYSFLRSQFKYIFGLSFFISKKTEYLILVWLVYTMMEFLIAYFKRKHNVIHYVFLGVTSLFFLMILFSGDIVFWDSLNRYAMVPSWIIGVISCFIILITKFGKDQDARLMFFSLLLLLGTLVNDVLVNTNLYKFIMLSRYGFLFFVASIALILSNRFFRLHSEVEDLNKNLEGKVIKRTDELNRTVRELEEAKTETDNILQNVQEGIFLLDENFRIGANYSKILESIFESGSLGGRSFTELLAPLIAEKYLKQTDDFLNLFFSHPVSDKRLAGLNPLDDVAVYFKRGDEAFVKYLNFAFSRIRGKDNRKYLLGTVRDITENKKLSFKIEETKQKAEKETGLFLSIIRLNPSLIKTFVTESETEMKHIEDLLESAGFAQDIRTLLKSIYASVHSIKGNAGMLGVKLLEEKAHGLEERLKGIFENNTIEPIDLVGLPYSIIGLKEIFTTIRDLLIIIAGFREAYVGETISGENYLTETLKNLVMRVADREKKKVSIDLTGFHLLNQARDLHSIKKILIQLVKNSIAHGIEPPEERVRYGKSATGKIEVSYMALKDEMVIHVRDDGRGIQVESLKEAALKKSIFSKQELDSWPPQKLATLAFETGITTREETGIDAGRGIGLDVVKEELDRLGGRIEIDFAPRQYTCFTVTIPTG